VSLLIKYTSECNNCGGTMSSTTLDLTQNPGETVEVNLDMLGDMTVECPACGHSAYIPGLADYIEDDE
jgi:DNA-directed RNA polymerase subunit RPC12/RpoP